MVDDALIEQVTQQIHDFFQHEPGASCSPREFVTWLAEKGYLRRPRQDAPRARFTPSDTDLELANEDAADYARYPEHLLAGVTGTELLAARRTLAECLLHGFDPADRDQCASVADAVALEFLAAVRRRIPRPMFGPLPDDVTETMGWAIDKAFLELVSGKVIPHDEWDRIKAESSYPFTAPLRHAQATAAYQVLQAHQMLQAVRNLPPEVQLPSDYISRPPGASERPFPGLLGHQPTWVSRDCPNCALGSSVPCTHTDTLACSECQDDWPCLIIQGAAAFANEQAILAERHAATQSPTEADSILWIVQKLRERATELTGRQVEST